MVKISIIFPVYNVEYYLEEALDSIVNQTIFDDIEVIIVDDGSTDKSRYIINKYALDYDNISIYREKNSGVSVARNYGLTFAKGEYIHLMDSDDFMPYDTCEKLYDFAKKGDYDIVSGPFLRFNGKKTWQETISKYVYGNVDENLEDLTLHDYTNLSWDMFVWNKIYKREFLEENNVQFPKGLRFQDNVFSIEVLYKASKIGLIPDFVFCWRERDDEASATQIYNSKRADDLITVSGLVDEFLKENIKDKDILANKYLKWLLLDIRMFIEMIPKYPEEKQEFLLESAYNIYSLIPKEYTKDLNTHFTVLYDILEKKDWENLLLFSSVNYKIDPNLPKNLKEEYKEKIDFKKDALGEDLDIYTTKISRDDDKIKINYDFKMPYISKEEDYTIHVKIVNGDDEEILGQEYIDRDEFYISADSLKYGESILMMTFELGDIKKEYYMKTVERESYSYENFDVDLIRGKSSYLRLFKRAKNDSNFLINKIDYLGDESIKFEGSSNRKIENIYIKDYLDFATFNYPIDYNEIGEEEYEFSIEIPYRDLLKAPIKRWDVYFDETFNKINLNQFYEFIDEKYRSYIKNFGNRFVIELVRYNPLVDITNLNNEKNSLKREKTQLINDKNQLTEEKQKLTEAKEKLERDKEKLTKDKQKLEEDKKHLTKDKEKLKEDKERLKEKNKQLKAKIEEYRNRKDVKTVDAVKRVLKK